MDESCGNDTNNSIKFLESQEEVVLEDQSKIDAMMKVVVSMIVVIFISKIIIDVFFDKSGKQAVGRSGQDHHHDRYTRLKEMPRGKN